MRIQNRTLRNYIFRIFKLIFLTDLIALVLFTEKIPIWLGYFLGSLLAFVNFYFQAKGAENRVGFLPFKVKSKVFKNFYLRYFFLIIAVILIIKFLSVNIFALFAGLIGVQVVIPINELLEYLFKKEQ